LKPSGAGRTPDGCLNGGEGGVACASAQSHPLLAGKENLGKIQVGNIVDVGIGIGLALNERTSISIGYDQSFVGLTRQNGKKVAGSARAVLGTLLLGGSYRFSDKRTLNFSLGVRVNRDPDITGTVRVPMMF
jgi:hypothetical protein